MKKPKPKLYCAVNLCTKEIGRRRGQPVSHEGFQPPRDYPPDFPSSQGWSFEEVTVAPDPRHRGPPRYALDDTQVARVTKYVAPPKV